MPSPSLPSLKVSFQGCHVLPPPHALPPLESLEHPSRALGGPSLESQERPSLTLGGPPLESQERPSLALGECSAVNMEFWNVLCSQVFQSMAPTSVSLPDPALLLQRLKASGKLQDILSLLEFESYADSATWTCGAVSAGDDDAVIVVLLPRQFYWRRGGSDAALLPVILLHYTLDLNSEPSAKHQVDTFLHFDLLTPPSLAAMPPSMQTLLTQLFSLHRASYVQLVHSALAREWPLSRSDFLTGLQVCRSSSLSVDLTPLVAALCQHSVTFFPADAEKAGSDWVECHAPLQSEELCRLLSSALSKLTRTCSLRGEEGREEDHTPSHCDLCTQQVNQALRRYLQVMGFRPVALCGPAHFWLDSATSAGDNNQVHS